MRMQIVLIYLFIISILGFILPYYDKRLAVRRLQRVSEKTLFVTAFFGGALFMYISMHLHRHKTNHKRFMIGLPLIILLQAIVFLMLISKGTFY